MKKESAVPYVIFEVANVHAGDLSYLKRMVDEFSRIDYKKKGIKFQIFSPDGIALPDFEWYPVYEKLHFGKQVWQGLIAEAAEHGEVWIDVFDNYGTTVLSENLDRVAGVKLQASVLENHEIRSALEAIEFGEKRLAINVSGLSLSEIQAVYDYFSGVSRHVILQTGYQGYPTRISDTGLQKISVLQAAFPGVPLCMADHADADLRFALEAPVYAALLGCAYIEKHFCLDRKTAKYDGFSSLEPGQVRELCVALDNASMASHGQFISDPEREYLKKSIQIPVANHNLEPGGLVTTSDVIYRRTSQVGLNFQQIRELQQQRHILSTGVAAGAAFPIGAFRPANIAVVVACRMKSSRLSKKALLPIAGVPSVERCLSQCLAVPGVQRVVLATSNLEADAVLKEYTLDGAVDFWQGDPEDVIGRYLGACEHFDIDVVIRVTADCPLILPEVIGHLIDRHFATGADYTAAIDAAVGTAGEIINTRALQQVQDYFGNAAYSEYMTWYFQNNPDHFKVNLVHLPETLVRSYRMTLDYEEDLLMFNRLYERLGDGYQSYTAEKVFSVLDSDPDISQMNSHLTLKYRTDKQLIDTLNRETRMRIA
ncbi:cytidylyltransferase domain-containing protein [Pusillimonas sp. T2]|uniref:cytidylyltransferase domain-containing protein n=1 Tax=Pusillimonas sp. T2 TaxID=1548123 RepID=UPI0013034B5D|nr:N-acetylneuraminate synthase family protein [Pusillimonas sp. T2]